jgi:hypothetical protein
VDVLAHRERVGEGPKIWEDYYFMNNGPSAALREYRAAIRRELKTQITELEKTNQELLHLWAYEKATDEDHLRRAARENLAYLEGAKAKYDASATLQATDEEIENYFRRKRMGK